MAMQLCPNATRVPSGKALVDTIPIAIGRWQQAPLGTAARDPEEGFEKAPNFVFVANVDAGTGFEKAIDFLPS
jgi:hypothetical protein